MFGSAFRTAARHSASASRRAMGSHARPTEPHVPVFHEKLGKACLVATWLWVMYRIKQDNGQFLALYQPWLHEHEHHPTVTYSYDRVDTMPTAEVQEEEH